jgi:NCS1 family nucleobase:cation symporter-1
MAGLGTFLAPIAAIMGADYWIVKKTHIDVPSLYRSRGRYRYNEAGTNWRAVAAFLISVVPNLPGMAASVNPSLKNGVGGAEYIYDMFYIWGFTSAFVSYCVLSHFFPEKSTLIEETIPGDVPFEEASASEEKAEGSDGGDEKIAVKAADYEA